MTLTKIFVYCIGRNMQYTVWHITEYAVIMKSKAFHVIRIKFPMWDFRFPQQWLNYPQDWFRNPSKMLVSLYQYIHIYTGCNRRNGPDFGRVFLMLNYNKKPQNTYIQSWTVWEIMASEFWNFDSCSTLTDYQIRIETGRNMWFL